MFASLLKAIQTNEMPLMDRFGIANDLFALFKGEKLMANEFLEFLKGIAYVETEYIVWGAVDQGIGTIMNFLNQIDDNSIKTMFNKLISSLLQPISNRLGKFPAKNEGNKIFFNFNDFLKLILIIFNPNLP